MPCMGGAAVCVVLRVVVGGVAASAVAASVVSRDEVLMIFVSLSKGAVVLGIGGPKTSEVGGPTLLTAGADAFPVMGGAAVPHCCPW